MDLQGLVVERRISASLLILCGVVFVVAGLLYTARAIWKWPVGQTPLYLRWERGLVIAAFMISVLGFVLLEDLLRNTGDTIFARSALAIYLISAAVLVVAETTFINTGALTYPQIVAHVILTFLAQAAFGLALLLIGLLPGWVGWATIIWNLGCLVVVPITHSDDIYFPWLHYVAPLIIGITLLGQ
jgi:hypothetical protein